MKLKEFAWLLLGAVAMRLYIVAFFAVLAGRTHAGLSDPDGPRLGHIIKARVLDRCTPAVPDIHRVEPMLPEVLSNHACSLVPGQERLTVTVELEVEGESVTRAKVFRSRIRSDERLYYDRVDRIFAGAEEPHEPWAAPLAAARAASSRRGRKRSSTVRWVWRKAAVVRRPSRPSRRHSDP